MVLDPLSHDAVSSYSYSGPGELTDLLNQDNMSNTLSGFSSLVYNASGSRTSATAMLTGVSSLSGTLSYGCDSKDEVTTDASSRNGSYSHSFSYDSAGNPTTWMGGSKSFNSDNQDTANTSDGNGNPTTYDSTALTFDPENRMTAYGSALTAGYRADGLRAWKDVSSQTYFLYDGETPVVELNSSGAVIATNTFGAAGLLSRRVSSTSTFYQFDPQGGTAQRLNSSCGVTLSTGFDAWGNAVGTAGSDPFQYGAKWGYYTDPETGLALLSSRYYDPAVGRFLNRDPLGSVGGANLYRYSRSNPASFTDPSGMMPSIHPGGPNTGYQGDPGIPVGPIYGSDPGPQKIPPFKAVGIGLSFTDLLLFIGGFGDINLIIGCDHVGISYDIGWGFGGGYGASLGPQVTWGPIGSAHGGSWRSGWQLFGGWGPGGSFSKSNGPGGPTWSVGSFGPTYGGGVIYAPGTQYSGGTLFW